MDQYLVHGPGVGGPWFIGQAAQQATVITDYVKNVEGIIKE